MQGQMHTEPLRQLRRKLADFHPSASAWMLNDARGIGHIRTRSEDSIRDGAVYREWQEAELVILGSARYVKRDSAYFARYKRYHDVLLAEGLERFEVKYVDGSDGTL